MYFSSPLSIWFLAATALTALLLALILKWNLGRFLLDSPTSRSLHVCPIPRIGGVAIVLTLFALAAIYQPRGWSVVAPPFFMLAIVSLGDDRGSLSVLLRLCVQFSAAITLVLQLLVYNAGTMWHSSVASSALGSIGGCVMLVFVVMWMMNLYNFMDGADGLAGGMAVIGFMTHTVAANFSGSNNVTFFAVTISGAALGFLLFNFSPARVFMGDAGSIPLGFLAGALGLMGNLQHAWPWWFPPLVFSPFIVDATVTLIKRACQRKKIWVAHREHYYQRLVLMGWSHKRLALTEYVLMLACAGSALYALQLPAQQLFAGTTLSAQHAILVFWCVAYLALGIALEIIFLRHEKQLTLRALHENRPH